MKAGKREVVEVTAVKMFESKLMQIMNILCYTSESLTSMLSVPVHNFVFIFIYSSLFRRWVSATFVLFQGIVLGHYDSTFRSYHQLCLSTLKRFGFGQRVMETRILMEVEEMINKVREEQGRPFDMTQLTTSCVVNIIINMLYGYRFDHSDEAFQQFISFVHEGMTDYSVALEIFPLLRFLPYFRRYINRFVDMCKITTHFIDSNISTCIEVCISIFVLLLLLILHSNYGYDSVIV